MVKAVTSKQEFETLINSGDVVLVDFWAPWCGPCRVISPVFEKFERETPNLKFIKVDVDESPDIAELVGIRAMPTFIAYKNGEVIDKFTGANPGQLETLVKAAKHA